MWLCAPCVCGYVQRRSCGDEASVNEWPSEWRVLSASGKLDPIGLGHIDVRRLQCKQEGANLRTEPLSMVFL